MNKAMLTEIPATRFDVTTFGEMLLRLSVPAGERLETSKHFDMHAAGAEVNVVSLLARLNRRTRWVGALPKNPLGRRAGDALRAAGVHMDGVLWQDNGRMGIYFVEFSPPPRGIQVIYDRANSCAAALQPGDMNWEILLDTHLLHLTGITPALSSSCRDIFSGIFLRAKQRNVPVSFDVNYRQKLWSEAEAKEILTPFLQQSEIVFCSERDARRVFGCEGSMQEVAQGMLDRSQARIVVITIGDQGAMMWDGEQWLHEPALATEIIDRLGAGDALAAGILYGWLKRDLRAGLRYGVSLAALALSQKGDMVITTEEELQAVSQGGSSLLR